ncbi:hypothetical protein [Nonomuraea sp. NPDC050786]|uniref:hypothetical protein n=1 Tax=Nonomuraea sp. NPDC050786 TaxID=3154840 RepID=UPI0033E4A459
MMMALTKEWHATPQALTRFYGPRIIWTGKRCSDERPVFQGSNGYTACACDLPR